MYSALFSQFKMKPLNHTICLWMIGGIVDFRSFNKVEFPPPLAITQNQKRLLMCCTKFFIHFKYRGCFFISYLFNPGIFGEYANSSEIVASFVKVQIYCQNMQRVTGCNVFFCGVCFRHAVFFHCTHTLRQENFDFFCCVYPEYVMLSEIPQDFGSTNMELRMYGPKVRPLRIMR